MFAPCFICEPPPACIDLTIMLNLEMEIALLSGNSTPGAVSISKMRMPNVESGNLVFDGGSAMASYS